MTDAVPRMLGGRYRLLSLLATGGMGQVWRGRDTLLDRPVAVKVLRSEFTGDATFRSRFRAEAHHSAGLVHRNIATLYDYGESTPDGDDGEQVAYLVMELVEGEALSTVLERERRLDPARTLDVLAQTANALAVAHAAGVVHRDIKPGNVLLGDDGVVRITDFGIAWSASSVPLTHTGQVVGTPHYLAPEQAAGERARPAGDVYALGLIGYECLAGERAFDGDNAVQVALRQIREDAAPLPPDVPEGIRALIARALVKDPADRFPDGAAFRRAIEDVQAGRPVPPPAGRAATPTVRIPRSASSAVPVGRRRGARALLPVGALALGVGIAVAGLQAGGAPVAPSAEAADATIEAAGTVLLVAADHVGRPVGEVEAELAALGLRVQLRADTDASVATGLVTGISPSGALRPGDLVTVTHAVSRAGRSEAPAAPPADPSVPAPVSVEAAAPGPGAPGGAPVAVAAPVPAPPPAPAPPPEPQSQPAPAPPPEPQSRPAPAPPAGDDPAPGGSGSAPGDPDAEKNGGGDGNRAGGDGDGAGGDGAGPGNGKGESKEKRQGKGNGKGDGKEHGKEEARDHGEEKDRGKGSEKG